MDLDKDVFLCLTLLAFSIPLAGAETRDGSKVFDSGRPFLTIMNVGDSVFFQDPSRSSTLTFTLEDLNEDSVTFEVVESVKTADGSVSTKVLCRPRSPQCTLYAGFSKKNQAFFAFKKEYRVLPFLYTPLVSAGSMIAFKDKFGKRISSKEACVDLDSRGLPQANKETINVVFVPGEVALLEENKEAGVPETMSKFASEGEFKQAVIQSRDALFNGFQKYGGKWIASPFKDFRKDFRFYYVWSGVRCATDLKFSAASPENSLDAAERNRGGLWSCEWPRQDPCPQDILVVLVKVEPPQDPEREQRPLHMAKIFYLSARSSEAGGRIIDSRPDNPIVFLHEFGHAMGLADEYCCDGGYFETSPYANLFACYCPDSAESRFFGDFFTKKMQSQYDRTNVPCKEFRNQRGGVWSRPAITDIMSTAGNADVMHSFDNLKVIECTVNRSKDLKCG